MMTTAEIQNSAYRMMVLLSGLFYPAGERRLLPGNAFLTRGATHETYRNGALFPKGEKGGLKTQGNYGIFGVKTRAAGEPAVDERGTSSLAGAVRNREVVIA
jgi:hypothetical protein